MNYCDNDDNNNKKPPQHFNHDRIRKEKEYKKKVEKNIKSKTIRKYTSKKSKKCICKTLDPDTHSLCSNICGCSKVGHKCSLKCGCKGICSNGKSISDELFFKVWRNIVLRNQITGDKNLEIIGKKNNFKKELLNKLDNHKIRYNENDIDHYTKLFDSRKQSSYVVSDILEKYFRNEKQARLYEFKNQFLTIFSKVEGVGSVNVSGYGYHKSVGFPNLFRGCKSEIVKDYVNAVTISDQLRLPPINKLVYKEIKEIEIIIESLKSLFEQEGLKFNIYNSSNIRLFIISGGIDTSSLILKERQAQSK